MTDKRRKATRRTLIVGSLAAMCGVVLEPRDASGAQLPEDATVFFPGRFPSRVQGRAGIVRAFTDLFGPPVSPPGSATLIQPQDLLIQRFDGFAVVTFHLGTEAARWCDHDAAAPR